MTSGTFKIKGFKFTVQVGDGVVVNPDNIGFEKGDRELPHGFDIAMMYALASFKVFEEILMVQDSGSISAFLQSYSDELLQKQASLISSEWKNRFDFELGKEFAPFIKALRLELEKRSKPKRNAAGYVYLIQSQTGAYKIGKTNNPENRMTTFSVKLPFEVEYIALIQTANRHQLEAKLHNRFASKRINGEWFALTPEDIEYIKSLQDGAE